MTSLSSHILWLADFNIMLDIHAWSPGPVEIHGKKGQNSRHRSLKMPWIHGKITANSRCTFTRPVGLQWSHWTIKANRLNVAQRQPCKWEMSQCFHIQMQIEILLSRIMSNHDVHCKVSLLSVKFWHGGTFVIV